MKTPGIVVLAFFMVGYVPLTVHATRPQVVLIAHTED